MKKKYFILVAVILFFTYSLFFTKKDAKAIPAFGRKYQISCQTCHTPGFPKLKAYGDEFAGNGFRLTEYESPRYYTETGDNKLSLLRDFPLAARLDGHITFNNANRDASDFATPFSLKILSGGELSKKLSYYFYVYVDERGKVAGVEDAYLMYHDLLGSGVNLILGQFQLCDPLFTRETRLTLEDYHIYTVTPGTSTISLKYDRGIMAEFSPVEGTDFTAMVVNGNGIGEADSEKFFDYDRYKNVLIRFSQAIGDKVSVGFFGYFGKEDINVLGTTHVNNALLFGPDITFNMDDILEVNLQYLRRNDSRINLAGNILLNDIVTHGSFAEIIYAPKGDMSDWYFTGLLNWMESDISSLNYKTATFHTGYMLHRNLRLVGEYTRSFGDYNFGKASFGFVSAF